MSVYNAFLISDYSNLPYNNSLIYMFTRIIKATVPTTILVLTVFMADFRFCQPSMRLHER
ncbi:hypothetical protein DSUL_150002 [Desulfovibrionales bacterium]